MSGTKSLKSSVYQPYQGQEIMNIKDPIKVEDERNSLKNSIVIDRLRSQTEDQSLMYSYADLAVKNKNSQAILLESDTLRPVQSTFQQKQPYIFHETDAYLASSSYPKYSYAADTAALSNKTTNYAYPINSMSSSTTYIPTSSKFLDNLPTKIINPYSLGLNESSTMQKQVVESEKSSSYYVKTTKFVNTNDAIHNLSYGISTPVQYIANPSNNFSLQTTDIPSLSEYIPRYTSYQPSNQYTTSVAYDQTNKYNLPIQKDFITNIPLQKEFSPNSTAFLGNRLWSSLSPNFNEATSSSKKSSNERKTLMNPLTSPLAPEISTMSKSIGAASNTFNIPLTNDLYNKAHFSPPNVNRSLLFTKSQQDHSDMHIFNKAIKALTPKKDPPIDSLINQWCNEKFEDGSAYLGEKFENKKNGTGFLKYADGTKFDGEFEDDIISGIGKLYSKDDKLIYDGEWKNGMYHNNGILHNILMQGRSPFLKQAFEESSKKVDKILENGGDSSKKKERQAEELSQTKQEPENIQSNIIFSNKKEEKDRLKNIDMVNWIRYDGEFSTGKKHGLGTLFLKGGKKFTGLFHDDMINGIGTYYYDGKILIGEWKNDEFLNKM